MSRLRSNCMVIDVRPDELLDVIWVTPETIDKDVSSGVATVVAIVSAVARGKLAEIWMVGKSTCGNEATGNAMYAMAPRASDEKVESMMGDSHDGANRIQDAHWYKGASHEWGSLIPTICVNVWLRQSKPVIPA